MARGFASPRGLRPYLVCRHGSAGAREPCSVDDRKEQGGHRRGLRQVGAVVGAVNKGANDAEIGVKPQASAASEVATRQHLRMKTRLRSTVPIRPPQWRRWRPRFGAAAASPRSHESSARARRRELSHIFPPGATDARQPWSAIGDLTAAMERPSRCRSVSRGHVVAAPRSDLLGQGIVHTLRPLHSPLVSRS